MSRSQQLYLLQRLDSQLDEANKQLAEVVAMLGEDETVIQAKKVVETIEKGLRKVQTTMLDLDLEVKSLADKIARQEKTLYSGAITGAKEAANLQEEVASLNRWHEKREELLLEAMVGAEEAEEGLDQAQAQLSKVQAEWATDQEDLVQTQSVLETKVAELMEQRPVVAEAIEAGDLNEYEDLRPTKAGLAVAAVKNGVCQGCGMAASNSKIQRARANVELTYCDGCARILYVL